MIILSDYIARFPSLPSGEVNPWDITGNLPDILLKMIPLLGTEFRVENAVAIHKSAVIEQGVIIKGPAIIGENCFIGNHAVIRNGVFLTSSVKIGPGCEVKASIICPDSAAAHFNFIGDSIIGSHVNIEAGAILANHYNERDDKIISVIDHGTETITGVEKFGALVGDDCRIGANAVLSPGTVLTRGYVVKRLELIDQHAVKRSSF